MDWTTLADFVSGATPKPAWSECSIFLEGNVGGFANLGLRWRVPLRPFQQSSHLVWTVSPMKFPSLKRLFQDYSRSNFECCTYIREHDNQIHAKMYSHDLLTCKYIHAVSTIHKLCSSARVIETKTYKNQFSSKNIKTRECATCQNTGCLCAMVRFCIQKMLCIIYGIYIHAPG